MKVLLCFGFVAGEIINSLRTQRLIVPRGNYTQLHLSGFGYGDASLETGISQVTAHLKFETELADGATTVRPFDLFRFTDPADYLCYVEAVHKLYH